MRAVVLCWAVALAPSGLAAQDPEPAVAAVVDSARAAAASDRNTEAAELFGRALARAPQLRRELLRPYADQLTYAGRAPEAVPLYEEVLTWALPPEEAERARLGLALALSWSDRLTGALREYERVLERSPGSVEARLGRARILSWRGRLGEARQGYEAVLDDDPGNREARRSLAQVQGWRVRTRDALERLEGILADHPEDVESLLILAQVRADQGRGDLAAEAVDRLLSIRPDHARALDFVDELRRRFGSETGVEAQRSTQTDDLVITRLGLRHALRLDEGRTTLELRYRRADFDREGFEPGSVDLDRLGVHVAHRTGEWTEVNLTLQGDVIRPDGPLETARPLLWDGWATWWPRDGLRLDVSSQRATFDDIRSLVEPVVATTVGASADVRPDERARVSVRGSRGSYSDGNGRWWGQLEGEWRAHAGPDVLVGARATAMRFDEVTRAGYFNPETHSSIVATVRGWTEVADGTWLNLGGAWGRERSEPGGTRPQWMVDARVAHWLTERLEVEARFDVFSSRRFFSLESESGGGWSRRTVGVQVRHVW